MDIASKNILKILLYLNTLKGCPLNGKFQTNDIPFTTGNFQNWKLKFLVEWTAPSIFHFTGDQSYSIDNLIFRQDPSN